MSCYKLKHLHNIRERSHSIRENPLNFFVFSSFLNEDEGLEMYITKEEYVFVLNELSKLNNYSVTIPDDIEDISVTLTAMPIEYAIVERYGVLYDLMFEAEYVSKEVGDDVVTSDRELDGTYSNYILGKKFSPVYNIEEDYQDYLVRNCKEK